jgi:unsaturated rhamnogalacturonyl hydrolase
MFPFRLCIVSVACLVMEAACPGDVATEPRDIGGKLVQNLLAREHMYYGDEALHYSEAATALGALRFAAATDDPGMLDALIERYSAILDDDSSLVSRRPHVDLAVVGIVPLQIAIQTGDARYLEQGLSFADGQWEDPLENGLTRQTRWWIDDLYMVGMLQIQAFRASGDPRYADRAARQLSAYLPRLQVENGLFYHGTDAPIFWGRGNGWVASALAEVLSSLPESHPSFDALIGHYRKMMETLLRYQADSGMWRQVLDNPEAWEESSATAMVAFAMATGVRHGFLDAVVYEPAVHRAWQALVRATDEDGNLRGVCVGTGKSDDTAFYLARPRIDGDFHGQAPMLWLATVLLSRSD